MLNIASHSLNTVLQVKTRMVVWVQNGWKHQVFDLVTPRLPESCSPLLPGKKAWFHKQWVREKMDIQNLKHSFWQLCIGLHLCKAGSIPKLGRCLEEEMATHLSILAWRIPWAEEPGRLQSMGSQSQTRLGWLSKAEVGDDLYYTSARCSPWKNWGKNTGGICVLFLQPCGNLQGLQINS